MKFALSQLFNRTDGRLLRNMEVTYRTCISGAAPCFLSADGQQCSALFLSGGVFWYLLWSPPPLAQGTPSLFPLFSHWKWVRDRQMDRGLRLMELRDREKMINMQRRSVAEYKTESWWRFGGEGRSYWWNGEVNCWSFLFFSEEVGVCEHQLNQQRCRNKSRHHDSCCDEPAGTSQNWKIDLVSWLKQSRI